MANPFDQFDTPQASGNPFDHFDAESELDHAGQVTKNIGTSLGGGLEATAGMVAGLPSMIAGGVAGLSTLASGQGYEKAAKTVEDMQQSNFGMGAFKPFSDKGAKYSENLGKAFAYPGEAVGETLDKYVGPKTAFAGKLLTDMGMQFVDLGLPIVGAKGLIKGVAKGVESVRGKPDMVPASDAISKLDALDKAKADEKAAATPANPFDQFDVAPNEGANGQRPLFTPQEETVGRPNQFQAEPAPEMWRTDENGMPIRADLSMDAQNAEAPLQRNLFGDELPPSEQSQQTRSLTEAIDTMPNDPWKGSTRDEALGRLQGPIEAPNDLQTAHDVANGSPEPIPSTGSPVASLNAGFRGQRGAIDIQAISDAISDKIKDISAIGFDHKAKAEEFAAKLVPQVKADLSERITKPDPISKVIDKAMDPSVKDTPPIWHLGQSGPSLTSEKWTSPNGEGHPVLQAGARELNFAAKQTDFVTKKIIYPLEKYVSTLNGKEVELNYQVMKREMFNRERYTPEELKSIGMSTKQIDGYNMWRQASQDALDRQNAALTKLGRKPITAGEAHLASLWHGDWHTPILDKKGNLVWFIKTYSKSEGLRAINHLRETMGDTLDVPKDLKPEFRDSSGNPNTPQDVTGVYHDIMDFVKDSPEISKQVQAALGDYIESKGYTVAGQNKHFLQKSNIRGFEGDRPWLSERENAYAGMKAQMAYLKSATRWSHLQEAIANIKELTTNPDVAAKHPNAIKYMDSVLASEFGSSPAVTAAIESGLAQMLGRSRGTLYKTTNDLKTMTYLQTLGLSVGYMVATPLQSLLYGPMWHHILTMQGFKHNLAKTSMLSISDAMAGISAHMAHEMGMPDAKLPMTQLGRQTLKYAEDNGTVTKNMFDESGGLGQHAALNALQNTLGWTIGFPEKVARMGTIMAYAHHLAESGRFPMVEINGKMVYPLELFRRAEELTDNTLTSFKSFDRPQIVNKLGVVGQAEYMYQSAVFNSVNNLSIAARYAHRGSVSPLLTAVGAFAVMGGLQSMPGVNEMDGLWNLTKLAIAHLAPQYYSKVKGNGLKGALISIGPQTSILRDLTGFGLPSTLTQTALTTRLNSNVFDPEKPFQGIAPVAQEMKEWAALGNAAVHQTPRSLVQGVYKNVPPYIQGQMETHLPEFKSGNTPGNQLYHNPNDLLDTTKTLGHRRNQFDEKARALGVRSLPEARDLQMQWIKQAEDQRVQTASKGLLTRTLTAIEDKDTKGISDNITAALKLNPDGNALKQQITAGIITSRLTPMEQQAMKLKAFKQIDSYSRYQQMAR